MPQRDQIFISHSQKDDGLLRQLDSVFGNSGVSQYKASFEKQQPPVSEALRMEIEESSALFVLLGPNACSLQHTKVWIGWEVGVASECRIPIWVLEDVNTQIEMAVPSFSNYILWDSSDRSQQRNLRDILESEYSNRDAVEDQTIRGYKTNYNRSRNVQIADDSELILSPTYMSCPYDSCGEHFRIWFEGPEEFNCPACAQVISIFQSS